MPLHLDPCVERIDKRGEKYTVHRGGPMPRIADRVLQCSVFLYTTVEEAHYGVPVGEEEEGACFETTNDRGASGFLVSVPAKRKDLPPHIYIVTNRHVITSESEDNPGAKVIRFQGVNSVRDRIQDRTSKAWFSADEDGGDLAVHLLADLKNSHSRFHHIPIDLFVTLPLVNQLNIGIGDEIFMVGRLIRDGLEAISCPLARFGRIACPLLPLVDTHSDNVFLAEYRSLGKASGSPVFLEVSQRQRDFYAGQLEGYEHLLLGVNRGSTKYRTPVEEPEQKKLKALVDSGMSMVVPAWKLKALLEREDVCAERQQIEAATPFRPPIYLD